MIDAVDRVGEDVTGVTGTCSLLDISPAEITDDTDVSSLLDSALVLFTDDMKIPSLLEMVLTKVVDAVLLETELLNINVTTEVCSLVIMTVIVEFSSLFVAVLVEVTDGAVVG